MNPIVQAKNLTVRFDNQVIIEDITVSIDAGQSVAVIGPNGSGKTTLVRALIGVIPYQGEVIWQPRVTIGYVPQRLDLDHHLPLTLGDFLRAKIAISRQRSDELGRVLSLVLLDTALLSLPLWKLSAGQFQRALIAAALIGKPDILILDEPTSGVDLPREEQIYDTIHRLQDTEGLTILIVSHDLNLVYRYALRVICLNRRLICAGPPQETLTTERLQELFGSQVLYRHQHS